VWYFWRSDSPRETELRLALLVDWHQVEWPGHAAKTLWGGVPEGGTIVHEIDLAQLKLQKTSQVMVVAFVEPDRPFWRRDTGGRLISDPEGGRAGGSNRLVVFSP
jgi:hypothetical protein